MQTAIINRTQLATDTFNGLNEALYGHIAEVNGYEMDGITYVANGLSKAQIIDFCEKMSDEDIEELEAVGLI